MKSPQTKPFTRPEAFILTTRDGTVRCATPRAWQWLREHFRVRGHAKRMPLELRHWLSNAGRKPGRCKPFAKENEGGRLVISLLHDEADNTFVLLFQKHELDAPHTRVRHHGITIREEEVIEALAAGKRNPEIAKALGIEVSTVKRHVEHILTKYHVDTRAAAVAVWQEGRRKSHVDK